jgi:serine/threonine protein kinase
MPSQNSLTSLLTALPTPLCNDYKLKELLGTGAYALVYKIESLRTGEEFALKVVEKAPLAARLLMPQLQREVTHLRLHSDTQHVVQLCDVVDTAQAVFLRFQLCEKPLDKILEEDGPMEEDTALHWFRQALLGVRELHAAGTVHRDLKLSNILVDSEGVLRICDFGWSCREDEKLSGRSGTPQYAPPEMLESEGLPHTSKVDIYSLGVCLQHMMLGRMPGYTDELPSSASPELLELLTELMSVDPDARPSADEILEMPLLQLGPLEQLWQHGQELLAQLGWPQRSNTASVKATGGRRSRGLKTMAALTTTAKHLQTPPIQDPSHCEQAAYWSKMSRTVSMPPQLQSSCRLGQNSPSRRFSHGGFCVTLGTGNNNMSHGYTSGYLFRR